MTALWAAAALAALFVVFGLLAPRGARGSCHGCPEEDGGTGGCEGCPRTVRDPAGKEVP